ncbi:hypothetical protein FVE85_0648 [Porphyridium purpureum]|uniref:Uncharacterized protein n=1 Tax=Porphyridium purpureum TaxID=35688 RepID=A0A5J4YZ59_PORPP|nr:hypothetical protein FVE85_0648 [Porphyridium purpureum]|eukprot:POR8032..scf208_2
MSRSARAAVVVAVLLLVAVLGYGSIAAHAENGAELSEDELLEIRARLYADERALDEAIAALTEKATALQAQHSELDSRHQLALEAHAVDVQRKLALQAELATNKLSVDQTRQKIVAMERSMLELVRDVDNMHGILREMHSRDSPLAVSHVKERPLRTIIDVSVAQLRGFEASILRRWWRSVTPSMDALVERAAALTVEHARASGPSRFFLSVMQCVLYGCILLWVAGMVRVIRALRRRISLSYAIFFADASAAAFWLLVLSCAVMFRCDPFRSLAAMNAWLFFHFQLLWLWAYIVYIIMRVLNASRRLDAVAVGELFGIIVVGHHHYTVSWAPLMLALDQTSANPVAFAAGGASISTQTFFYACYAWLYCAIVYMNMTAMMPLRQIKGAPLSLIGLVGVLRRMLFSVDGEVHRSTSAVGQLPSAADFSESSESTEYTSDDDDPS